MIAIIDYGMGNLRSVQKALERVGSRTRLVRRPGELARCDKIVLPGVGAFGDAMKELRRLALVAPLKEAIASGTPFLGLCLGMQLFFEKSEEAPSVAGLAVLEGRVRRFRFTGNAKALKVPHMGWNTVEAARRAPSRGILAGVPRGAYFYFVHSYYVECGDDTDVLATTRYGARFVSAVRKGSVYGLQFHPEKSQAVGLRLLENFVAL